MLSFMWHEIWYEMNVNIDINWTLIAKAHDKVNCMTWLYALRKCSILWFICVMTGVVTHSFDVEVLKPFGVYNEMYSIWVSFFIFIKTKKTWTILLKTYILFVFLKKKRSKNNITSLSKDNIKGQFLDSSSMPYLLFSYDTVIVIENERETLTQSDWFGQKQKQNVPEMCWKDFCDQTIQTGISTCNDTGEKCGYNEILLLIYNKIHSSRAHSRRHCAEYQKEFPTQFIHKQNANQIGRQRSG